MFVSGDVVASITVDVIFLAVVSDVINVYLAVDVTTVDVFFATAVFIVVSVAVPLVTADTVSLVVITVVFIVGFVSTIKIDVVCHAVINVAIVDFFDNITFAGVFVVVVIVVVDFVDAIFLVVFVNIACGIPQFRCR